MRQLLLAPEVAENILAQCPALWSKHDTVRYAGVERSSKSRESLKNIVDLDKKVFPRKVAFLLLQLVCYFMSQHRLSLREFLAKLCSIASESSSYAMAVSFPMATALEVRC